MSDTVSSFLSDDISSLLESPDTLLGAVLTASDGGRFYICQLIALMQTFAVESADSSPFMILRDKLTAITSVCRRVTIPDLPMDIYTRYSWHA